MLKKAYRKALLHEDRINAMMIMKYCLERFKETNNEEFWNWAKIFGDWSKLYKKQLDNL